MLISQTHVPMRARTVRSLTEPCGQAFAIATTYALPGHAL
jgi:hypothetical protein